MDTANNNKGQEIAKCGKDCFEGCYGALMSGELIGGIGRIPKGF